MNPPEWGSNADSRRAWLKRGFAAFTAGFAGGCETRRGRGLQIATFYADVTVPVGHGMMGGAWLSKTVADPLEARGVVLWGDGLAPVIFVSVDWCEIRNDAYARWQKVLATAASSSPERVMVSTIHQHDAPVADLGAEAFLRERQLNGTICDPGFHEVAVQRVAAALAGSMSSAQPVSHIGMGAGRVERVASNRRYTMPGGQVRFDRMSATRNTFAIAADEGLVDPWLKCLSFCNRDEPVAALSFFAVHPMSYYGQGDVSADFPGMARRRRQSDTPKTIQIYVSGCSGNVTAGKYNTGARENRAVLADRIYRAMVAARDAAQRVPITRVQFRVAPMFLEPRSDSGFREDELRAQLVPETKPFQQCLAAMGLSWRRRVLEGRAIEVPCLDFGAAALLLLPGESYVEYQRLAQTLRPHDFICVAGYGDGATGYVPTERHWAEGDTNLNDWCWVAPGSEARMRKAIRESLRV